MVTETLQSWMGHADTTMIMEVYAKLSAAKEQLDAEQLDQYVQDRFAQPLHIVEAV